MKTHKIKVLAQWFLFVLSLACVDYPQTSNSDEPIKVNTVLLNVPVVVSDRNGRNIAGLTKDNFSITQGGEKQPIEFFANQDDPMNVAIIIDSSGSTAFVIGSIIDAARSFVDLFSPNDKGLVVSFDNEVHVLSKGFTPDKEILKAAISLRDQPAGRGTIGSVMNDAIYSVITKQFAEVKGRKAIVVLTDGDVHGKTSRRKLLDRLIESDVVVYPIFFQTRPLINSRRKTITYSELVKISPVDYLNSIALATGGKLIAADGSNFDTAFQNIADELRKMYILGFYPSSTGSEEANDIKIDVDRVDSVVRSRRTIRIKTPSAKDNK